MSRVRVVALPSDLFRFSKPWCFVYAFGVVLVLCLFRLFVCYRLMAYSLVVVIIVIVVVDVVMVVMIVVRVGGLVGVLFVIDVIVVRVAVLSVIVVVLLK